MKFKNLLIPILVVMILSLALAGCGGTEPTQSEVEEPPVVETESAAASPEDPQPVKTQVTNIDQIVGTWIAPAYPGNFVLTVFPDGKLSVATSLEDLEAGSTDSWNLVIDDGQISASDFALCLGDIGTYIAEIDKDGNLRFVSIIDACDARLRKMDRSLPGRLHEYILIFRPVE